MKALTIPEIAQALWEVSSVLILTHRRPDGDTAGSAAALCRGLRSLGKKAFILENPQLTERYRPYHRGLTCPAPIPGALVVSVDVAGREMLCKVAQTLPVDLLLDHHGTNPGFAARGHIDPSAGACGEIIYRVLTAMGLRLDRPTAEALYVAVSTDTGCFRYSNTTAHTLQVAAACLEAGAKTYPINKQLFETTRLCRLRLNAYMAQHLELLQGGTLALCLIPLEVERETGVTEDDLEDVSNFARNVEGVQLAVTFRTVECGDTKLSVRSAPGYDAAAVCAALGGGGHAAAAGATLHCNQAEARTRVLEVLRSLGMVQAV